MNDLDITDQRETNSPPDRRPTNIGWKVFWRRAFAFLIDGSLMSIFTILALIATGVLHKIMGSDLTGFLQNLDELLKKYRAKWHLNALAWLDYDDVCQIIRIHIFNSSTYSIIKESNIANERIATIMIINMKLVPHLGCCVGKHCALFILRSFPDSKLYTDLCSAP